MPPAKKLFLTVPLLLPTIEPTTPSSATLLNVQSASTTSVIVPLLTPNKPTDAEFAAQLILLMVLPLPLNVPLNGLAASPIGLKVLSVKSRSFVSVKVMPLVSPPLLTKSASAFNSSSDVMLNLSLASVNVKSLRSTVSIAAISLMLFSL